jgi:acetylornithine deacetylase/succinyl-diaminopimelate desuccinylase-like protein
MRTCSEYTGDYKSLPRINAGGTYSRYLDSSAEVGTTLIWETVPLPQGHGGAHQPDENISVQGLLKALELIVNMLIECDRQ